MAILGFRKFGLNLHTFAIENQAVVVVFLVLGKYSIHMLMFSWLLYHFVEYVQLKQAPILGNQILFSQLLQQFT